MENIDTEQISQFKSLVKEYLTIDDKIKVLTEDIKKQKKIKEQASEKILKFMENYNIEDMKTESGRLQRNISYTKKPLNQKTLKSKLAEYFQNEDKGGEIAKFVLDKREKEKRVTLKRVFKKK